MTNGELLRKLFEGYARQDDDAFRTAATAIVENERAKNHRLLADDLNRILFQPTYQNRNPHTLVKHSDIPLDRERGFPLLTVQKYHYDWHRLVLPKRTQLQLKRLTDEHRKRDILSANGIQPKQRILFYGLPGCGKTVSAQVLASVLYRPLITVRLDAVISSYLGETAANLRKIFQFIEQGTWVVLFDEFDAIAKDRNTPHEHGELKRVVNTLLQLMDNVTGESLLLAATNHEALLDRALWRRFDAVIEFPPPSSQERISLLHLFLNSFDTSAIDLNHIGYSLKDGTGADVEWFCQEVLRHMLLEGRQCVMHTDVQFAQKEYKERRAMIERFNIS